MKQHTNNGAVSASTSGLPDGRGHGGHHTMASHAEIAKLAYEIYLASGSKPGHCQQNWQKAEYDLNVGAHKVHLPPNSAGHSPESDYGPPLYLTPPSEDLPPITLGSEFPASGVRATTSLSHRFTKG